MIRFVPQSFLFAMPFEILVQTLFHFTLTHLPLLCDSQDEGLPPHNHSTINKKPKKTSKPLIRSNAVSSVVLKISFVAVLKFLVLFKILTQTLIKVYLLDLVILVLTKAILNVTFSQV